MKLNTYTKLFAASCFAAFVVGCGDSAAPVVNNSNNNNGVVPVPNAVYTLTNNAATNAVREYRRNTNGSLTFVADYPTGGSGSGDALNGSTNALTFDALSNRFYAVNANSNSISVMSLNADGTLSIVNTVNSGGIRPVSVTSFADLVYVLNFGDNNTPSNITGFRLVGTQLQPIANSTQALSVNNPNPAQIQFGPTGTVLAVTERDTDRVTTFVLDAAGAAAAGQSVASNGATPFGFDFTPAGVLVVSEAQDGNAGAGSLSSYTLAANGSLSTISNSVLNGQTGSCWVEISDFAPFAYVANTGTDNISVYNVDGSGALTLQGNGNNAATGDGPVDLAISNDNAFLYVLNTLDDSISAYTISQTDGSLTPITGINGLPASSVGLVAR